MNRFEDLVICGSMTIVCAIMEIAFIYLAVAGPWHGIGRLVFLVIAIPVSGVLLIWGNSFRKALSGTEEKR